MSQRRLYARRLALWFVADLALIWLPIFPIILVILVSILMFGASEPSIRIGGMVLQLMAVIPVAYGLFQIRKIFKRPGLLASTRAALKRMPRYGQHVISMTMGATISTSLKAEMVSRKPIDPEDSAENRIAALEYNLGQLEGETRQAIISVREAIEKLRQEIIEKIGEQIGKTSSLMDILKSIHIDGFALSAAAIAWLFCGIVMSSMSVELHGCLGTPKINTNVLAQVRIQPRLSATKIFLK